jgi:hypothetical protein
MFGGLDNVSTFITMNSDDANDSDTVVISKENSNADTIQYHSDMTTKKMARCTIDTMKSWTTEYPPNMKPMCLHAAYLKLKHPVSGEVCEWNTPAAF